MVEIVADLCFRCFTISGRTSTNVIWLSNNGGFIASMENTTYNTYKIIFRGDGVLRIPRPEFYILDGKKPLDLTCHLTTALQSPIQHSIEIYSASRQLSK